MKLANRVSAFFLTALAAILLGNSLLLYVVARGYLVDRFDEQLESTLQTLVAAVEVEDDDVKWESSDHTVMLGAAQGSDEICWIVLGDESRILDLSRNLVSGNVQRLIGENHGDERANWKFLQRELIAPHPKPLKERGPLEQSRIRIVVARDASLLQGSLRRVAMALVILPAVCWLVAAAMGRWFVDRAILPVREMARNVRQIRSDDTAARLPVAATHDELHELGSSFNELLDAIFVAYERQRQFAGDAAHQLRTPLTVLQGHVDVALRRTRSEAEYRQTLSVVQDEVHRLSRTVDSLLRLARPDDDSLLAEKEEIDLSRWLQNGLLKWTDHERKRDIQQNCESPLRCRTRPDLLEQVLEILLSNALKYSAPGSRIDVNGFREGAECVLEVVDQGPGIPIDDQSAIFEPFYRTRDARQSGAPGIGLGLALARRIADSLNARLECESQPGRGSTFRVRFTS